MVSFKKLKITDSSLYSNEKERIKSLVKWPIPFAITPVDLAIAGFYYSGIADQVICFSCNGHIHSWAPIDQPIIEHARWFPKCSFLRNLKDDAFIENIQNKYKNLHETESWRIVEKKT